MTRDGQLELEVLGDAPDYSRAFVKVPRTVLRQLRGRPLELLVYIELLDRAAYRAGSRLLRSGSLRLERGEAVFGREELAEAVSSSEQPTRRAITNLRTLGILTTRPTNAGTIATLCGYGEIADAADSNQPANQPRKIQRTNHERSSEPTTNRDQRRRDVRRRDVEKKEDPARVEPLALTASGLGSARDLDGDRDLPARTSSPENEPSGQDAIDLFTDLFTQANLGAAPKWGGRELKAIHKLVGDSTAAEVMRRTTIMFAAPPAWPPPPYDVATLARHFDRFASPTAHAQANGHAKPSPTSKHDETARIQAAGGDVIAIALGRHHGA